MSIRSERPRTESQSVEVRAKSQISRAIQASRMKTEHSVLTRLPRYASKDPVPFVIVFQARTGSNMVRSALNVHPGVRCYGEVLRSRAGVANNRSAVGLPAKARSLLLQDPARFLDEYLYGPHPANVRAIGFKLAHGHAREPEWLPIWAHLADRGVRILELRRDDVLATLISYERAFASGQFVTKREVDRTESSAPLLLTPERCEKFFDGTKRRRQQADHCFAQNPRRIFEYSDLIENWAARAAEMQEFLDLPVRPVEPLTKRQAGIDAWKSVANIAELRTHFEGSEYSEYFTGLPKDLT